MEPFVRAARSVLEAVSGGCAESGQLGLRGTTFPTAATNIAVRVNGTLEGDLIYSMSSQTARKLATKLTGREARVFGRVTGSGLSQLSSLLIEKTAEMLIQQGEQCEISNPTIFQGMNVEFSVNAPALAVPIDTDAGQVDINVAVRKGE